MTRPPGGSRPPRDDKARGRGGRDDKARGRGGRSGGPRRRSDRNASDPERQRIKAKADKLVQQTGIPRHWALQVAEGKLSVNDVLTRLARADRIKRLEANEGLDRSTAAQVSDGHLSLAQAHRRQRLRAHLAEHHTRSVYDDALAAGTPVHLWLHGQQAAAGRVTAADRYEITVLDEDGTAQTLHKLQVKLVSPEGQVPELGTAPEGLQVAEPVPRPQDRFHLSDKRLFVLLDEGRGVRLRTLEGELVDGTLEWLARWELGLRVGGVPLVIMRHAVAGIEELP